MYSNDSVQIKQGLTNYIGAMIQALKSNGKSGRAVKQDVAATLIEEAMKLATDDEQIYDIYVLKPLLRGNILLLLQRVQELKKLDDPSAQTASDHYLKVVQQLKDIVDKIN